MIIAIDFDGTIVEHRFPEIGKEKEGAIESLKKLKELGHRLILWTCRDGQYLVDAIKWLNERGLEFEAYNCNVEDLGFQTSHKIYADLYIDDRSNFRSWEQIRIEYFIKW